MTGAIVAIVACESNLDRAAKTLTSAATPNPASTAVPSHVIDNAGYVDNGGRTSDETARTEMSGMRATETQSVRITGTPGSGWGIPTPTPARVERIEVPVPTEMSPTGMSPVEIDAQEITMAPSPRGMSYQEASARVARARCDREGYCGRVGTPGARFESDGSCMASAVQMTHTELSDVDCARGFDPTQLGACLNEIRSASCEAPLVAQTTAGGACARSAVCAPL